MEMKEIFRYLAMLVVVALPVIIGFVWGYLFEQDTAVWTGGSGTAIYSYIRPSLGISFYVEIFWFFIAAIFILPRMIGKIPESKRK
jgi:predicted ABC-type exoprotein transport system permease subunit